MQQEWYDAGFEISTVSADSRAKAQADVAEFGWTFPVASELSISEMKKLGVYISEPLSPDLAELLDGMIFTIENDRPARGMYV